MEVKVLLVLQEALGHKVLLVHKVLRVQELKVLRGVEVRKVLQVLKVLEVLVGHRVHKVLPDHLVVVVEELLLVKLGLEELVM